MRAGNSRILKLLERQRDMIFKSLNSKPVSSQYRDWYQRVKAGEVYLFDNNLDEVLRDLQRRSEDKSFDFLVAEKLKEYLQLDNEALVEYFQTELIRVFGEIKDSGKQDEMQAMFIEYDYYYHYDSVVDAYGQQDYPLIETPRYITDEYDYTKQVFLVAKGINFKPALISCEAFEELDFIEVEQELITLFQLHSRTLLHIALSRLDAGGELTFLKNRPFTFYINEHDCEVMTLYRMT